MRQWMLIFVVLSNVARAESDCADAYTECKDDCVLEYGGSIRVDMKKRFDKCLKRCTKTAARCDERVTETRDFQLDEGSLDRPEKPRKKQKATAEPGGEEDTTPSKPHDDLTDAEVPKSSRTTLKTEEDLKPKPPAAREEQPVAKVEEKQTPKEEPVKTEPARKPLDEDVRDDGVRKQEPEPEPAPPPPKKKEEKPKEPPKKEEDHDDLRYY